MWLLMLAAAALGASVFVPHQAPPAANVEGERGKYGEELKYGDFNTCSRIVVFLHGLGEEHSAERRQLFQRTVEKDGADLCFVLPLAPLRVMLGDDDQPLPDHRVMRMWYRVKFNVTRTPDAPFYAPSLDHVIARTNTMMTLAHAPRVFLGGFSQGCGLALAVAYSNYQRLTGALAGAMCFSGYIVNQPIQTEPVARTPLLWAHNEHDTSIGVHHAVAVVKLLRQHGLRSRGVTYLHRDNHAFAGESLKHLVAFVDSLAPRKPLMGHHVP